MKKTYTPAFKAQVVQELLKETLFWKGACPPDYISGSAWNCRYAGKSSPRCQALRLLLWLSTHG